MRAQQHTLLIIGYGHAGRRFADAARYLQDSEDGQLALVGVCDVSASAREDARRFTSAYEHVEEAMEALRPSAVVVAVNEEAHAEVLHRLAPYAPQVILCEKPLTATVAEAESLPASIVDAQLSVHFVERHSPVLVDWFEWASTRSGLKPLRVEFFWGKHRIGDQRPTMGVMSEVTHPVDLVDYLFGFEQFEIVHAYGLESDYSPHHSMALDTISFVARTEDFAVIGVSSFAWPRRHRAVSALLVDDEGMLFRLTIDFDTPRWDCDALRIELVDPSTGQRRTLVERRVQDADYPEEIRGVAKVAEFIRQSLAVAAGDRSAHPLVDYGQALKIQHVLGALAAELDQEQISRLTLVGNARMQPSVPFSVDDRSASEAVTPNGNGTHRGTLALRDLQETL
jgi:predicted dehydrogenase